MTFDISLLPGVVSRELLSLLLEYTSTYVFRLLSLILNSIVGKTTYFSQFGLCKVESTLGISLSHFHGWNVGEIFSRIAPVEVYFVILR